MVGLAQSMREKDKGTTERRVLVMDDEPMVRSALRGLLRAIGWGCDEVIEGRMAVHRYHEALTRGAAYDAVILDLHVPGGMDGRDTLAAIMDMDPNARVVISSGYIGGCDPEELEELGCRCLLPKPFRLQDLQTALGRATAASA